MPIPPPLVRLLRDHLKEFGTATDGRLFSSERGSVIAASSYSRAWKQAREPALVPDQEASALAKCIDGQEQEMNDRIMQGLGEEDDTAD